MLIVFIFFILVVFGALAFKIAKIILYTDFNNKENNNEQGKEEKQKGNIKG